MNISRSLYTESPDGVSLDIIYEPIAIANATIPSILSDDFDLSNLMLSEGSRLAWTLDAIQRNTGCPA